METIIVIALVLVVGTAIFLSKRNKSTGTGSGNVGRNDPPKQQK